MKKVLGTLTVTNGHLRPQLVVISQEITVDKSGVITTARKFYTLNSIDGEPVRRTSDPNTFMLDDGTMLKRSGHVQLTQLDTASPHRRNHRQ